VSPGRLIEELAEGDCYKDAHRTIYRAVRYLHEQGAPAGVVAVVNELRRTDELEDVGGPAYLAVLLEEATTPSQFSFYARLVRDPDRKRAEIRLGHDLIERGYNGSPIAEDLALLDRERAALAGGLKEAVHSRTCWALATPAPTFLLSAEDECNFLEDRIL